jgi:hypothetical protein
MHARIEVKSHMGYKSNNIEEAGVVAAAIVQRARLPSPLEDPVSPQAPGRVKGVFMRLGVIPSSHLAGYHRMRCTQPPINGNILSIHIAALVCDTKAIS